MFADDAPEKKEITKEFFEVMNDENISRIKCLIGSQSLATEMF